MNKTLKKTLLIAGIAVAVCAAVWGGLTLARNAQRGDVNVYQVSDFAMTDYWGDTANTSGTVNTDKLQKIYISETQEVSAIYVKEGQNVKKGDKLLAYDSSCLRRRWSRRRSIWTVHSSTPRSPSTIWSCIERRRTRKSFSSDTTPSTPSWRR